MLLVVDVGNTQTVVGLYEIDGETPAEPSASAGLVGHWRAATEHHRTDDQLMVLLSGLLELEDWDITSDIEGVAVSSGVPRVTTALREMSVRHLNLEPIILGPGVKTGMPVRYENPREVGADRIANAVGAFDLFGGPTIVVDFGTGTTFDAISGDGEYLGGAIAPGVEISLEALFERAAALRAVELVEPQSVIGRSTMESLQSGAVYGYAAQVDGLVRRIETELGEAAVPATGGLAPLIAPHCETVERVEPWLTLHGLRLIWAKNA